MFVQMGHELNEDVFGHGFLGLQLVSRLDNQLPVHAVELVRGDVVSTVTGLALQEVLECL